MNFSQQAENAFQPMQCMRNAHLQTILPRLVRRHITLQPHWQRLTLPDSDFIDLAWSENPEGANHKPRVVLFHGLEGSVSSPYAHGLLQVCQRRGWLGVVMHFCGCSGEPNQLARIYHSGETGDATFFLQWLRDKWGTVPTVAVGFSLGGNMLSFLMGEQGDNCLLDAGVVVSAPLMLEPCSFKLEQGFSRVYQHYLLNLLKQNAERKLIAWPGTLPVDLAQLKGLKKLRDFDDAITARAHGFLDATDYYRRCSALPLLPGVRKPLLIIHAKDDPFMTAEVIPDPGLLPASVKYQLTRYGGHVGFVGERSSDRKCGWSSGSHNGYQPGWTTNVIIPWKELEAETLDNLIESFVLREGTDYGELESSLEQKVKDVRRQLSSGEAVLVWSELHETVNIMPRGQVTGKKRRNVSDETGW